ncbi:hypothetical protein [Brevibacterium sp. ZH18]|uniref:hypothetical protein n=1 Tax=Brevibacterium sp. ZH18 TaxID=2927784 RepID=UPI001F60985F|nr:hypothetical protein [Brevibacterium sp. ZH18]MCI4010119.1 hypothetical protein [Brevibacterium sp. ZH18]
MATKAMNVAAIEKALGEPWADTRARLEAAGGTSASHKELADALYPQFEGVVEKHGWWVQGAVIAYEQEIGSRVPGQRADGTFDVAVSRTVAGERTEVVRSFAELVDGSMNGVDLDGEPRTSETPKRSFWRANLADGSKIEAAAESKAAPKSGSKSDSKSGEKSVLVVTASKLMSAEALEDWRAFLKDLIKQV